MLPLQCNICRAYIYTLLVSCRHYNVMLARRILKAKQKSWFWTYTSIGVTKTTICNYNQEYQVNMIWPCCLRLNSTDAIHFGLCLLNLSRSDLTALLFESLRFFGAYQSDLRSRLKTINVSLLKSSCVGFHELPGAYWSPWST